MTAEYNGRLIVTDSFDVSFEKERLSGLEFAQTVISFLKENFKGAIEIKRGELPLGSIRVAAEGFAYFLKLLLREVMGEGNVKAALRAEAGRMIFEIKCPKRSYSVDGILYYAEKSGFGVSEADEGLITLSIPVTPEKVKTIYAISPSILRSTLVRIILNA